MRFFSRSIGKSAIPTSPWLASAILVILSGCPGSGGSGVTKQQPPDDGVASAATVSWEKCLDDDLKETSITPMVCSDADGRRLKSRSCGDPGGQGRELLGVGFKWHSDWKPAKQPFVRIDRFPLDRVVQDESNTPVMDIDVDNWQLSGKVMHNGSPEAVSDWNGVIFEGKLHCTNPDLKVRYKQRPVRVKIVGVEQWETKDIYEETPRAGEPAGKEAPVYRLKFEYGERGSNDWRPACEDPADVAFPMPGYWQSNGAYDPDPSRKEAIFSFACVHKAVAKCMREGYSPKAANHSTSKVLFEACTRMMRADYCGKGYSFTYDGSLVLMWDGEGVNKKQQIDDEITQKGLDGQVDFEAAWDAGGLVCRNRLRYDISEFPEASEIDAACQKKINTKCTVQDATAKNKNKKVLFNDSCIKHSCGCEINKSCESR